MNFKTITALSALAFCMQTAPLLAAAASPDSGASDGTSSLPAINCEIKNMSACTADGNCKAAVAGDKVKLPIMLTVDFNNNAVAVVNPTGFPHIDKIDSIAKTKNQLIATGIDGEFAWQVLLSDKDKAASLVLSTADTQLSGFGTCSIAK